MTLLSRDKFRAGVFARDKGLCVVPACGKAAADAHHILERRLWLDGGYYLANGASVCPEHHLLAETTELAADDLRRFIGIERALVPPHLYDDEIYDKWGNPVLPNGQRLRGELFDDESVQKALRPVLHLFTNRVKYPRTYHLPWSPSVSKDDRVLADTSCFEGQEVVITVKMDGENTTMYRDYLHARSLDYQSHPSRTWAKAIHAGIAFDIPEGWRVCGENLYAKHAIHYQHLTAYFQLFSVWNEKNVCLSWDDTITWAGLLGVQLVPVLFRGTWNETAVRRLFTTSFQGDECEGYVVRLAGSYLYRDFRRAVGKYVRANHVGVHAQHWRHVAITENKVAEERKD